MSSDVPFGGMGLLAIIDAMGADLRSVDVCDRQINDVTRWRLRIEEALLAAAAVEGASAGLAARWYGSATHRQWLLTSYSVIQALRAQETQAQKIHKEALQAAAAAGAAAADAEARAGDAREGSDAEAAALAEAAEARAAQAAAEQRAAAAAAWRDAAADAKSFGETFIPREDNIHRPVGVAVAQVGPREVAQVKTYHQAGA